MEASHPDYGTSMWYNSAMYQEPDAPHDTIQSTDGVGWYAIPGTPVVERRIVYEGGKPVYDGGQIKTTQVEAIRYKSTLTRYAAPQPRDRSEKRPPRRKQ